MSSLHSSGTASSRHETKLLEAVGRVCVHLIDDPFRRYMASQRLRVRAVSSIEGILQTDPTVRHPIGQVQRSRSTTRLLLPRTPLHTNEDAESVCGRMVQILAHVPTSESYKSEACGIFEELVTNAIQHGSPNSDPSSSICHTVVEYSLFRNRKVLTIGVYDNGIGLHTLHGDSNTSDEIGEKYRLLLGAAGLGITGTKETRGIGLFHTREIVRHFNGCMYIASDNAHAFVAGDSYIGYESTYRLPGWLITATLLI